MKLLHFWHSWGVWQPLSDLGRVAIEYRPCLKCPRVQLRHVPTLQAKAYAQLIMSSQGKLNGKDD